MHASAEHAELSWNGVGWSLRDKASTNGTWLNGVRLGPSSELLVAGALLSFGSPDDPWQLIDESPPGAAVWDPKAQLLVATGDDLALGTDKDVSIRIRDGSWELTERKISRQVQDGEIIVVDETALVLLLPQPDRGTRPTRRRDLAPLSTCQVELDVSSDEEYVELRLRAPDGGLASLPRSQACLYVLVTLARLQLQREQSGERWVDASDLASALRYSPERVNVEVFRVRSLLKSLGVPDASSIVERTRDGRLRIGAARVVVNRRAPNSPA